MKKKIKKSILVFIFVHIFVIVLLILLKGCYNPYDIRICNYSSSPIEEAGIEWGKLSGLLAFIPNNSYKTIVCANTIEPNYFKETIISWVDEQGNKHSKKVLVPPKPMFKHFILFFEIRKNEHVSVYVDEDFYSRKSYY